MENKERNVSVNGVLYLVATPVGNLEDITLRALKVLREVDIIAAEDTRQTIKLLNSYEIKKPLVSYFEHNKRVKGGYLIRQLLSGKNIALVSDAGTPGISDPGEELVKQAVDSGIRVTLVPGPAAAVMGLVLSGLPAGRFVFEGFLPMNKRSRKERAASLKSETRTIVLYEAPHKLIYTLKDLYEALGDRKMAICRELTKKFEEITRCTISEAISKYGNDPPRGEFVLVIEGADEGRLRTEAAEAWSEMDIKEHVELYIGQGMEKKEAIKKVSLDRGVSKREIYNRLLGK